MRNRRFLKLGAAVLIGISMLLGGCQKEEAVNHGEAVQEENSAANNAINVLKLLYQPNQKRYEEYLASLDHDCNLGQCFIGFSEHDVNRVYLSQFEDFCTDNCILNFDADKLPVYVDYLVNRANADVKLTNIQLVDSEAAIGEKEALEDDGNQYFYYTITMEKDEEPFSVQGQIQLTQNTEGKWQTFFVSLLDQEALSMYITGENIYAAEEVSAVKEIKLAGIDIPKQEAFFAEAEAAAVPIKLKELGKVGNGITLSEEWLEDNQWKLPVFDPKYTDGELDPADYPNISWENGRTFYDEAYIYSAFNDGTVEIYDRQTKELKYIVSEFLNQWTWRSNFAKIKDDILYIGNMYNGYATPDSSYLMAYDLVNDKLLWRSEDQTYNSGSFVMIDDVIICGYGFTEEPDYLYQIDANTGRVIDKTKLDKMADYIIEKDGRLYIHTYSFDYIFEIESH